MYGYPKFNDPKDPDAIDTFYFNWSLRLRDEQDTITDVTLTSTPVGLTLEHLNTQDNIISFRCSGGVADTHYYVQCRIATAQGRVLDQTSILEVAQM